LNTNSYSITAIATDNVGNLDISQVVSITVINAIGIQDGDGGDVTLYPNPVSGELVLHLGERFTDKRNAHCIAVLA